MTTVAPTDSNTVRRALRADLLGIHRVERAAFEHPWELDAFEQFLGEPGFLVAESDAGESVVAGGAVSHVVGHVVGTGVRVNGRPMGHIKDLAVLPDHQGNGIGSSLLQRSMAVLEGRGFERVRLEVRPTNERALGLYERHGFSQVGVDPEYYPDGEDAFILHAPL